VSNLIKSLAIAEENIYNISHEDAVGVIKHLTSYQQDMSKITEELTGYLPNWK